MKKFLAILVLGLLWCNVGFAECADGVIDETKLIGGEYTDGTSIEHGHEAVSCEGIAMYYSTKQKKYLTKTEFANEDSEFTDVEPAEPYSGHKITKSDGLPLYYSTKQKKYITCKKFNREGGKILNPEKKGELFYGWGHPICHGYERKTENGIEVYDAIKKTFVPKPTLSERIQKHISSELIEGLIGLIIVLAVFRYRHQVRKSISSLFSKIKSPFRKIKSPFKKDWKRIMLTLSILYLCIMYYLNWWGHQGGMFIYKMTYSWFLRWGLIPVVSGWIIYYIWRKEK